MTPESKYEFRKAVADDLEALVQLRIAAMKPSLLAVGRFDPERARERFSATYNPSNTSVICMSGKAVGFYVLADNTDHLIRKRTMRDSIEKSVHIAESLNSQQ